nr:hypothetical protein [Tanacetum cinerariifolium]
MNDFCSQKGIKREFSNARTLQQNGVAERRNRTLIEEARTMLAIAKLLVTFWAEAVNTTCYVQNRVLVNKSQNKTPYELFNGMFEAKRDEGYFIRYYMSSKAFRVFNKRTRRVKENLHVEFLENKAIEKGAGPNWLFDINSLTKSMNYVPVDAGTNSTNLSGTNDAASQEVKKDVSSLRYIALPNWVCDALLESSSSKPQDDCSTDVPKSSGNCNPTATLTNPSTDQMKSLIVETPIPTVSSPVPTICLNDSLEPSSDTRLISKRVDLEFLAKVYKVEKAMYGLHQAPRAWLSMPCEALSMEISPSILRLYASTFTPTIYVSYIRQFWSTARIETTEEGTNILTTIDGILRTVTESSLRRNLKLQDEEGINGILRTVTESSLRRNLKLQDEEGISSLPNTKLVENLTLMGYKISPNQKFTFQKDDPTSLLRDVSKGEACPTDSGFEEDQDRANIVKTSTLPHDSVLRVTSLAADEGSMQLKLDELMGLCTSLERQHSEMGRNLDEGEAVAKRVSDDTEEMVTVLTSMETSTILASGAAEVPTSSGSIPTAGSPAAEVPTSSDVVPTASLVFATATVVTPYRRRKGKGKMVESETPKEKKVQEQIDAQVARELEEQMVREDQRMSEQVARDAEIARIYAEEELQIMIDGLDRSNETVAKYMQEYHQFATELPLERRIKLISDLARDYYMAVIKSNLGWKEEEERFKRKGIRFEHQSVKKLKTSEEVLEEVNTPNEVPEEKVKEMIQLVPIEEVYVEALQVKHPIIDWKALVKESLSNRPPTSDKEMELWVELKRLYEPDDEDQIWTHTQNLMHALVEWKLYDMCGVHQLTSKDKEIFMLVEKDYPLRKGLAIMMICYKLQVENYSHMENDLILKIYKIASYLSQQVIEFPLPEEVPTASEESSYCQKKREATAVKIALLLKSRRNCQ